MPRRRILTAALIFTAVLINYVDRVALSVAAKPIAAEFALSPVELGYLLSSFLWAYVVCLVPLGLMVDHVDTKRMIGSGLALWSAATAMTAAISGFASLLIARLVMGASEASSYPASARVIRDWFPERERGLVTTLLNSGSTAGPAVGAIATAVLAEFFGWRVSFLVLGLVGFVWLVAWMLLFDTPERARWLTDRERDLILAQRNGLNARTVLSPPSSLAHLLGQKSLWGLILTQACLVYTAYLFLTWLPTFLQSIGPMSTLETGYLTAIPYAVTTVGGLVIAHVSDRALTSRAVRSGARRYFVAGMAILSIPVVFAPYVGDRTALLALLTLVLTGSTTGAGLNFTLASDLLENPADASRVVAMTALGGNLFGLCAPILTGYAVAWTHGYQAAFAIAAALLLFALFVTLTMTRRPIRAQSPMFAAEVPCRSETARS